MSFQEASQHRQQGCQRCGDCQTEGLVFVDRDGACPKKGATRNSTCLGRVGAALRAGSSARGYSGEIGLPSLLTITADHIHPKLPANGSITVTPSAPALRFTPPSVTLTSQAPKMVIEVVPAQIGKFDPELACATQAHAHVQNEAPRQVCPVSFSVLRKPCRAWRTHRDAMTPPHTHTRARVHTHAHTRTHMHTHAHTHALTLTPQPPPPPLLLLRAYPPHCYLSRASG